MPAPRGDDGFSMMEVIVAMVVFTVMATAALGLLLDTTDVARDNLRRTAAANLLTKQIEQARGQSAKDITDGRVERTETVGGTTYTIVQTANYVPADSGVSICAGTGNTLSYKLVTVRVTWPEMGSIKPVRGDTLRALGVGEDGLDSTKGTLAVSVTGATGAAQEGITVTLSNGSTSASRVTGQDGCAVFTGLAEGSWSATVDQVGYTGAQNTQAVTASLGVVANQVRRGTISYDTRRDVNAVLTTPAGAALPTGTVIPAGLPLRVGGSYVTESTPPSCTATAIVTTACSTGIPGTIRALFPEVYAVKAGSCTETTPSSVSVDLRPQSANGTTVNVPMAHPLIRVRVNGNSTYITNRPVTATHAAQSGSGCTAGETYTLPAAANGGTRLALPYGTWTLSTPRTAGSSTLVTTTITYGPGNATNTVTLAVQS